MRLVAWVSLCYRLDRNRYITVHLTGYRHLSMQVIFLSQFMVYSHSMCAHQVLWGLHAQCGGVGCYSDDDWDGRVHSDDPRADDPAEPPLSPTVMWTGLTIFQRPEEMITVEQETHDKAAKTSKGFSSRGEPTAQHRAEYCLTHLPHCPWCQYCVKTKRKERQSRKNTGRKTCDPNWFLFCHNSK